jgi:subtilisin family serine protease
MSADKLAASYTDAVKDVPADQTVTALVHTKVAEPDREQVDRVHAMLRGEHLATRRVDLLRELNGRYGSGQAYAENLAQATGEAHAKVVDAAPTAQSLWLAGVVAVEGTPQEIEDLAGHEDVVRIEANPTFRVPEILQTPLEDTPETVDGSAWGLAKIAAPDAWGGYGRGQRVLIGHLDTGVDDTHPALAGKVAAFQEFDFAGNPVASPTHDSAQHGTHTAGTMVGRSFRGVNIGVAPDARLASALVLPGGGGSFAQIIAGMQWTIAQRVDVINMSLGALGYSTIWNAPVFNATFSGTLVVASIGNSGDGTSGGPGNDPLSVGVGATHYLDHVAGFSSGQTLVSVPWLFGKRHLRQAGHQRAGGPGHLLDPRPGSGGVQRHVDGRAARRRHGRAAAVGRSGAAGRPVLDPCRPARDDRGLRRGGRDQRVGFGRVDALSAGEQAVALR